MGRIIHLLSILVPCAVAQITTLADTTTSTSTSSSTISSNTANTNGSSPLQTAAVTNSNSDAGAIVGGVIGGVALVALIAFGVLFLRQRRRLENLRLRQLCQLESCDGLSPSMTPTARVFDPRCSCSIRRESLLSPLAPAYHPAFRCNEHSSCQHHLNGSNMSPFDTRSGYAYSIQRRESIQQAPVELDTGVIRRPELA